MKSLNKVFEYKGWKFNMKIELEVGLELNGKKANLIVINCMEYSNFYEKSYFSEDHTIAGTGIMTDKAKKFVDDSIKNNYTIEQKLSNLGFK